MDNYQEDIDYIAKVVSEPHTTAIYKELTTTFTCTIHFESLQNFESSNWQYWINRIKGYFNEKYGNLSTGYGSEGLFIAFINKKNEEL